MKRVLVCWALILLLLSGCMGGGSQIVLPDRQPVAPPTVTPQPEPEPQVRDKYLVAGGRLLGVCTADGVWKAADTLPAGITDWTLFGETVTQSSTLPGEMAAGTLAVSGGGAEKLSLYVGSAWKPASDLLYALVRTLTGTEPLFDQPDVALLGSGDLLQDGTVARILSVRDSYRLLVLEHNGSYSALPDCTEFYGAFRVEGRTLLLCGDQTGGYRLLTWGGEDWTVLLSA